MECVAELQKHDWQSAYALWRQQLFAGDVVPNSKQQTILEAVHARCVHEHARATQEEPPFLKLIHGLPGSGKSKLLTWIRSYFEDVWHWEDGREFVFLAPLNSMACNIGGSTVHGWGRISFQDKRGFRIQARESQSAEAMPAMSIKDIIFLSFKEYWFFSDVMEESCFCFNHWPFKEK